MFLGHSIMSVVITIFYCIKLIDYLNIICFTHILKIQNLFAEIASPLHCVLVALLLSPNVHLLWKGRIEDMKNDSETKAIPCHSLTHVGNLLGFYLVEFKMVICASYWPNGQHKLYSGYITYHIMTSVSVYVLYLIC